MTPENLEQIATRIFGSQTWQAQLARHLGMKNAREIRRWASGTVSIPRRTAKRIALLSEIDPWIIGDGLPSRREFVTHSVYPRFTGRIALESEAADFTSGITYPLVDGTILCEIIWHDPIPDDDLILQSLFEELDNHILEESHKNL